MNGARAAGNCILSHLATRSCWHSRNAPARAGSWRRRWETTDPRVETSPVAFPVDLEAAMLKVSPNLLLISPTPSCTISKAPLFSVEERKRERDEMWRECDDSKIKRLCSRAVVTRTRNPSALQKPCQLTFGSVFAFVVNLWTRHTLLNIAPKASVNPVERIQARAWQICAEQGRKKWKKSSESEGVIMFRSGEGSMAMISINQVGWRAAVSHCHQSHKWLCLECTQRRCGCRCGGTGELN